MPGSVFVFPRRIALCPRRAPWWLLAVVGAALALGGCLQDAHNADKRFAFDNPNDPTATSSTGIVIAGVDYASTVQTVYIVNASGTDQAMLNWVVLNSNTGDKYTFLAITLSAGKFVRVHPGVAPGAGTDTSTDVYSGNPSPSATSPTWNLNDVATLQNAAGQTVKNCTVGSPTC